MRLLGKIAIGGGLASAATATWLVAAGVFATSATLVALDPGAPGAQAAPKPLTTFSSCDELLDWYRADAADAIGPYGWKDGYPSEGLWFRGAFDAAKAPLANLATTGSFPSQAGSATGTNTQEASVDEPDVAKTNGTLVARIVDDNTLVLVDVTGAEPRVLSRLALPHNGSGNELLLVGTHVLVTQQTWSTSTVSTSKVGGDTMIRRYGGRTATRLFDIDIADPTEPRILSRDRYSGELQSARQYGETVRLVTSTGRPQVPWVYPGRGVTPREATRRNRALVRALPVERWMPSVIRDGVREPLVTCEQVLHPKAQAGTGTIAVTTFSGSSSGDRTAVALTAGGGITYSSADRLYVATSPYYGFHGDLARVTPDDQTTSVHAFDVTGSGTTYVGSGDVKGRLRDRWSLDEYDGHLRVAWSRSGRRGHTTNGISVLAERDGALVTTGTLGNLGIDEDIQSVRWFDARAILVTFRQIDPLYTVDLTDAANPKLLGALKIPGYSGYLHPIGEDLVLGLGVSGDEDGNTGGAQAALFDVSDPTRPKRLAQRSFRLETYFQAIDDPRALTWLPASSSAVTPLEDWRTGRSAMTRLTVDPEGSITATTLKDLTSGWQARTLPLPDGRIAVLDRNRLWLLPA